jgi:hypothetical protein
VKHFALIALVLLALLFLGALPSQAAPSLLLTTTPSATPDLGTSPFFSAGKEVDFPYTSMGPESFLPGFNPLTGLPVADPTLLLRRPIAIKVTNYPRYVRPQPGLSFADVVYEYYLEEGISRFIAVYYGQDASRVGPVRSGRLFDEHVFNMYDAIFVFGYADPDVMDHYRSVGGEQIFSRFALEGKIDEFHDCSPNGVYPLCRDRSLQSYNNLFANTSKLGPAVVQNGSHNDAPDLNGMRFSYQIPAEGSPAERLFFRYSLMIYGKWEYDYDSARYLRFQEEVGYADTRIEKYDRLIDSLTDEQISADNVVALFVPHSYYKKTDSTEIFAIDLTDSGNAIVFRNGLAYNAVWVRPAKGVLNLYTPAGEPFPLKPGQTWYEVFSLESTQAQNGSEWRFVFGVPEVPDEKVFPPTPTPAP